MTPRGNVKNSMKDYEKLKKWISNIEQP